MKKILILALSILNFGCRAQSQIINILDKNGTTITDAYYQDSDFLLNQFEGNYLYTNGTTSLNIVLVKKVMQYTTDCYQDLIIGEYHYIENGVEKINTLLDLENPYLDQRMHQIDGNKLLSNNKIPRCPECEPNEWRLRASFIDPLRNQYGTMITRKIIYSGQEAIKVHLKMTGTTTLWIDGQPQPPTDFTVPAGEYILIKQP